MLDHYIDSGRGVGVTRQRLIISIKAWRDIGDTG